MDLTFRRHDTIDAELSDRWLRLAQRSGAGVFCTPQWCAAWLATIGSSAAPRIIEMCRADETIALLPLCRVRRGSCTWLELVGAGGAAGDALDIVGSSQLLANECDKLIAFVLDGEDRVDGLRLANLDRASPFALWVERSAETRALMTHTCEHQCRPCVDLPAAFDEYLATLSSNMRYHIRRRRRDAVRCGAVVRRIEHDDELPALMELFFDLHAARWRDNGGGGFGNLAKQAFLRRFCRDAFDRGWLRAFSLTVGAEAIGVLIAFHFQNRCSFYQMGWRDDRGVASPGVVLLAASIEAAIQERITVYDFLQGEERYKSRWTHRSDTQHTLWIGKSMAARAIISAARIKQSFTHALRRLSGVESTTADAPAINSGAPS